MSHSPTAIPTLLATMLTAILLLTGCQQQTAPRTDNVDSSNSQSSKQANVKDNKTVVQSDSVKARVAEFQPMYVTQMQSLQRRLQAEYEALKVADNSDNDTGLLVNSGVNSDKASGVASANEPTSATTTEANSTKDSSTTKIDGVVADNSDASAATADKAEVNTSTEVGERDLEVLKRISLEPRQPEVLTEKQIIERYQQTMQALYQPVAKNLSAENIDTLLNMTTLLPRLFEHPEIAERLTIKSPALARLIIQQQVLQQIEAQQVLDMQQMQLTQQQEFDGLMTKFNDTIKDYDKQISKYEQTLKEFQ